MTYTPSFRENWEKMTKPENSESISISPVNGTNAYLTKNFDGSMGLFLSDINDLIPRRKYLTSAASEIGITISGRTKPMFAACGVRHHWKAMRAMLPTGKPLSISISSLKMRVKTGSIRAPIASLPKAMIAGPEWFHSQTAARMPPKTANSTSPPKPG